MLALSGTEFTPYGEQCVREWRGQRKKRERARERENYEKKCSSKEISKMAFFFKLNLEPSKGFWMDIFAHN